MFSFMVPLIRYVKSPSYFHSRLRHTSVNFNYASLFDITSLINVGFMYSLITTTFSVSLEKFIIQQYLTNHQSSPLYHIHPIYLSLYGLPFFCVSVPEASTIAFWPMTSIESIAIFNSRPSSLSRRRLLTLFFQLWIF
jgi:hypothetical protein